VQVLPIVQTTGKFFAQEPTKLMTQIETVEPEDEAELWATLSASMAPIDEAVYYRENPFVVNTDGQIQFTEEGITRHVMRSANFINMVLMLLDGGLVGWGEYGTYQEVKDSVAQLDDILSSS